MAQTKQLKSLSQFKVGHTESESNWQHEAVCHAFAFVMDSVNSTMYINYCYYKY